MGIFYLQVKEYIIFGKEKDVAAALKFLQDEYKRLSIIQECKSK